MRSLVIEARGGDDVVDVVSLADAGNTLGDRDGLGRRGSGCAERGSASRPTRVATVTLAGGDGDDTFQVGTLSNVRAKSALNVHSLGSFAGTTAVSVDGGLGADRLVLDDSLPSSTQTYTLTAGSIARGTVGFAFNTAVEDVTLVSGGQSDTFEINGLPGSTQTVTLDDGGGDGDTLDFSGVRGRRRGHRSGQHGHAVAGRHRGERAVLAAEAGGWRAVRELHGFASGGHRVRRSAGRAHAVARRRRRGRCAVVRSARAWT